MKNLKAMLIAAGALGFTPMAASADSLLFQGLTFTLSPGAATNEVLFSITGTPTGDWSTVNFLKAFSLKPTVAPFPTNATITSNPSTSWTVDPNTNQSGSGFCDGSANGATCFLANTAIALQTTPNPSPPPANTFPTNLSFDINFTGTGLDLNVLHLQIAFIVNANDTKKTGNLVSEDIVVPGPIVGAGLPGLIFACGGLLGLARHRRRGRLA